MSPITKIKRPQWIVSDTHFAHSGILEMYPERATYASTVEEMDGKMIAAWNERVGPDDSVLHLGDFALGEDSNKQRCFAALNGDITLIKGNHDFSMAKMISFGALKCISVVEFTLEDGRVVRARHKPRAYDKYDDRDADILLHGHCHGNGLGSFAPTFLHKLIDCSMEALGVHYPITLKDFTERFVK